MTRHLLALATTAAVLAAAPLAAHAQAATYAIDPTHTFVTFEALHFNTSTIRARFDRKEGTVQFDRAGRSGRAEITIDMASVSSGVPPFDNHLRGKDFFDVATHPSARFVGERFVFDGNNVREVQGTLTLMGRSQPVTLKASRFNCFDNPMLRREVCGGDFETTISRAAFGITGFTNVAPDAIRLLVQIEAVRQQ